MQGPASFNNLLWLDVCDRAMADLPRQERGLYLCENQAWERAFIHAWRKHGHGRLIGVAHSTVRFWDLRYFSDPRTLLTREENSLPQPDRMALNGRAAVESFRAVGYPEASVVECEALRFSYLADGALGRPARPLRSPARVLVLGDYHEASTVRLLRLLQCAAPDVRVPVEYFVKSHPSFTVDPGDYPGVALKVVTDPLERILTDFDIAYSSNATSAAVEAFLYGLPVIVSLDETGLNVSPLRGQSGVQFVSSPPELRMALEAGASGGAPRGNPGELFFLDPELPRWKRVVRMGA